MVSIKLDGARKNAAKLKCWYSCKHLSKMTTILGDGRELEMHVHTTLRCFYLYIYLLLKIRNKKSMENCTWGSSTPGGLRGWRWFIPWGEKDEWAGGRAGPRANILCRLLERDTLDHTSARTDTCRNVHTWKPTAPWSYNDIRAWYMSPECPPELWGYANGTQFISLRVRHITITALHVTEDNSNLQSLWWFPTQWGGVAPLSLLTRAGYWNLTQHRPKCSDAIKYWKMYRLLVPNSNIQEIKNHQHTCVKI